MYDIAREQSPDESELNEWLQKSLNAGYNAVGFYLEHRFAYQSAPWAEAAGALQPDVVKRLVKKFSPNLRIIPFLNTLGHLEGFIRSQRGQWLAEGGDSFFHSSQMCPSRTECIEFSKNLVLDAMDAFEDEWVHLGGDETDQLGNCSLCKTRAETIGKSGIYGEFYGMLCNWVLEKGKRPCLWGDMLIQYPEALKFIPKQTIIFDWHYDKSPAESTKMFRDSGYEVVCCPALHTFDALWCHWNLSKQNIDDHITASKDSLGVCVTTWELTYLTNYKSVMPLIYSIGRRLNGMDWNSAIKAECEPDYLELVEILGNQIPAISEYLAPGKWRKLRNAVLMRRDPFLLWREWREEACGEVGDRLQQICESAREKKTDQYLLTPSLQLLSFAIAIVREIESVKRNYENSTPQNHITFKDSQLEFNKLIAGLHPENFVDQQRLIKFLDPLTKLAKRLEVISKQNEFNKYRPSWEVLIRPGFVPGDQAAWFSD